MAEEEKKRSLRPQNALGDIGERTPSVAWHPGQKRKHHFGHFGLDLLLSKLTTTCLAK